MGFIVLRISCPHLKIPPLRKKVYRMVRLFPWSICKYAIHPLEWLVMLTNSSRCSSVGCRATGTTVCLPKGSKCSRKTRHALAHLAHSTPAQFSSFYGNKLFLPEVYVSRNRMAPGAVKKMPAQMSLFGVGAPEALLVAVVALVVLGPKGLADAAKSVGAALRSFQPTLREVVSVTTDLRGTLEQELGLDELRQATRLPPAQRRRAPASAEDYRGGRRAAGPSQSGVSQPQSLSSSSSVASVSEASCDASFEDVSSSSEVLGPPAASMLSDEALEAELARRREAKIGEPPQSSGPQA